MKSSKFAKLFVLTLMFSVLVVLCAPTAFATAANVNIEPGAFDPDNVTINVNDQVVWTWVSDFHSTTSDTSLWDSGVNDTGFVFTNTFTSAGTFPYFCVVHGFTGTVNVQTGNSPPTVAITSPTNGAALAAPAIVSITATASDSDGSVTNVAFFDGATLLGATNNPPYTVTASLAVGSHTLTAVATDNLGLSTTSSVVNVTVTTGNTPPSVTVTNPADNAAFGNTDTVTVQASVSDLSGTVTNVQLFNGAVLLRSFTNGPYNFLGTALAGNFALGTNTLTAVATDNLGATSTSAPVHVIIGRYTPELTNGAISLFLVPVATNMAAPDYGVSPPGDTHRLFVLEQNGLMRIIQDGVLLPTPAFDLRVLCNRRWSHPIPLTSAACSDWPFIPASTTRPAPVIKRFIPTTVS